ncbi:cadherin-like domain-containing protein [Pseudomonas stutzeri]|nr:cadherin-like domain-containing protein [Stutzerimonas stutzeri]
MGNDSDVDGDSLSIASVTSGTGGSAVLNADGTVTFTPDADGTVTFTPDADFNGVATFSYTVTDGNLVSNTATVTVNVAPVNDAGDEGPRHHRQSVAVDVAVVGQQADAGAERHVLADGDRIVLGHR